MRSVRTMFFKLRHVLSEDWQLGNRASGGAMDRALAARSNWRMPTRRAANAERGSPRRSLSATIQRRLRAGHSTDTVAAIRREFQETDSLSAAAALRSRLFTAELVRKFEVRIRTHGILAR